MARVCRVAGHTKDIMVEKLIETPLSSELTEPRRGHQNPACLGLLHYDPLLTQVLQSGSQLFTVSVEVHH